MPRMSYRIHKSYMQLTRKTAGIYSQVHMVISNSFMKWRTQPYFLRATDGRFTAAFLVLDNTRTIPSYYPEQSRRKSRDWIAICCSLTHKIKKNDSGGLDTGCREAGKAQCTSHLSVQFPVSSFQFSRVKRIKPAHLLVSCVFVACETRYPQNVIFSK